jgi:hypothetical protein
MSSIRLQTLKQSKTRFIKKREIFLDLSQMTTIETAVVQKKNLIRCSVETNCNCNQAKYISIYTRNRIDIGHFLFCFC